MLEQMSLEEEKTAFKQLDGYTFCFLFLGQISENDSSQFSSLENWPSLKQHVVETLENVRIYLKTVGVSQSINPKIRFETNGVVTSVRLKKYSIKME